MARSCGLFSYPTHFTPPTTEDDRLSWLRLIRSRRIGPATFHRLIAEHGCAATALAELPAMARAAGLADYTPCPEGVALAELRAGSRAGARLLLYGTPDYPDLLAGLPDAPPLLWSLGDQTLLHRPAIALVGARNASSLGGRMARLLAEDLGKAGLVVVSGLARGIDTVAHRAALATGTAAVLAGGLDITYPPENAALMRDIATQGLLVTEQPFGLEPQARHFPLRNRIIAGLSRAVVVVEAAAQSGSLITARLALDQGREVLAVPGHPFDGRAGGCNLLIRDGATLVRGAEDVVAVLQRLPDRAGWPAGPDRGTQVAASAGIGRGDTTPRPGPAALPGPTAVGPDLCGRILSLLGPSPVPEDQLIRDLGLPVSAVAPELVTLEVEGRILRQPGGMVALAG